MRQYIDTLQDVQGNALVGASILVQNYIGGANASIFSDNGLTPILTSTVATGADGQFSFFAADGNYNLVMSKNATIFKTQSPVVLFDGAAQLTFSDTGAANAYAVSNSDLEKALRTGLRVSVLIANTSTGASTFQYNGLAAKPMVLPGGAAFNGGQVIATGIYRLEYDGTNWELSGGSSSSTPNYPQNAAESAAAVVPVNPSRIWGDINRYGTNTTPGTTDMSSALTNALLTGMDVYLPSVANGYFFGNASAFNLQSGQTVYGDGEDSLLTFSFNAGNNLQMNNVVGAGVRDLAIVITGASSTTYSGAAAITGGSSYCKVQRIKVSGNSACGAYLNNAQNCLVRDNRFTGANLSIATGQADIYLHGNGTTGCSYNVVEGNQCFGGTWFGIIMLTTSGTPHTYNVIANNRISGPLAYGIANYSGAATIDNFNQIIGNYIENVSANAGGQYGAGIYTVGAGGDTIANNIIRNCCINTSNTTLAPAGIGINASSATTPQTLIGNTISGMTKYNGIYVVSSTVGAVISGNSIAQPAGNTTGSPISVNQSSNVVVSGNLVTNASSQPSIAFNGSTNQNNWTVSGNNVSGAGVPLQVAFSSTPLFSNVSITGNQLSCSAALNGIVAQQLAGACIQGNLINVGAAAAMQINVCTQTRVSGNTLISTTGGSALTTSGVCTGSYVDESNYINSATNGANQVTNSATGLVVFQLGTAIPSAGTAAVGDTTINSVPTAAGVSYWRCSTAGTNGGTAVYKTISNT
jgi:hypothetical protein